MLKFLPIIPSQTSQNFDPLFIFIPTWATSSPISYIYLLHCIDDNNVHNTHSDYYTGEQYCQSYMKHCYFHGHLHQF